MGQGTVRASLRDGHMVDIRPLGPQDRARILAAFARLSPESRYRRFFGPMPSLSRRDLDYLTQIDHHDHEALVALDPDGDCVGVARFVRVAPDVAEPAVAVIDDWQGRGVGTALLAALVDRAGEEGVARFRAPVLASNADAVRVLERLGDTTKRRAGRELELTIALPVPTTADGRLRHLLRAFASGGLQPARSLLERLWPRRPGSPDDRRENVIVVGSDGSDSARQALEMASELALASGASVEIIGVHGFLAGDPTELATANTAAAEALRARGVPAVAHTRRGDPALALTDHAEAVGARLLVVGASRRSKGARRFVPGVSDTIAERSPCDVLIVRPRAERAPSAP